jgi:NTE family protein
MSEKLGLILEGGGVKGAFQVGALRALFEAGFEFDGIAGTSIGALNGACLISNGFDSLTDAWEYLKHVDAFDFSDDTVSMSRLDDFDLDKIRRSPVDFGCVAYNITDMKPVEALKEELPLGKLIDYVIASASFPIFPPRVIDGKKYIDGGVFDNLPVNLLARKGYKKFIVIRTNPMTKAPKRRINGEDLDLTYIAPDASLGRAMAFSPGRIEQLLVRGYNDARKVIAKIRAGI